MDYSKSLFAKIKSSDLQDYLRFKSRGSVEKLKKGKGSYSRKK